jgi:hypothetical protein
MAIGNMRTPAGMNGKHQTPPEIDTTRPSIARVYDYVLGGRNNFAVDREAMIALGKTLPDAQLQDAARTARAFLARGVLSLAAAGIRQFLDLGSGLPTMENTHQVAQSHAPDTRVVYVDIDPMVRGQADGLLADNGRARLVTADLRAADAVLSHPEVLELIDLSQPVAVLLLGVLHHFHDSERPGQVVRDYMRAVPSGSYLFLSHFCSYGPQDDAVEAGFLRFLGTGRFRTLAEINAWFEGLDMVDPGVVPVAAWRPEGDLPASLSAAQRMQAGGIGRKP